MAHTSRDLDLVRKFCATRTGFVSLRALRAEEAAKQRKLRKLANSEVILR